MRFGFIAILAASSASAQTAPVIDVRAAQAIIAGCTAHATANRNTQAIAVVDTGGRLIAALRMDRTTYGKMDFAVAKATAAAAWGFDTAGQGEGAKDVPGFADAPQVETVPGGIPVWSADGRQFIGGVGVSGAAPADDVACARAGVTAAGLKLERVR